jgi:hypothetical protein
MTNTDQARAKAEASFKKEERAREGAKAWTEYQADAAATQEKTARLRALRLAREAAGGTAEKAPVEKDSEQKVRAKPAARSSRAK